jgi:hypothetical protein
MPVPSILLRGDVGLPPGVTPLAPAFQHQLRLGKSPQDALDSCYLLRDYGQHNYGEALYYEALTHTSNFENPYLSMTTDLGTAILYANAGSLPGQIGYVTGLAALDSDRVDNIGSLLELSDLARRNREWGLVGAPVKNEILFQLTLESLNEAELFSHVLAVARGEGEYAGPTIAASLLTHDQAADYFCPVCKAPLWFHFRRSLGDDVGKIHEIPFPDAKGLFFGSTYRVDAMAKAGLLCRCRSCQRWLYSPESYPSAVVTTSLLAVSRRAPTIEVVNNGTAPIHRLVIGLHGIDASQQFLHGIGLGPTTLFSEASWPTIRARLAELGVDANEGRDMVITAWSRCEPTIKPKEHRILRLNTNWSADWSRLHRVSLVWAQFGTGHAWSSLESYFVDWAGLL